MSKVRQRAHRVTHVRVVRRTASQRLASLLRLGYVESLVRVTSGDVEYVLPSVLRRRGFGVLSLVSAYRGG